MPEPTFPNCSILLLAGGRGRRMGGRDKGLLPWRGQPLIAWLHAVVRPLTDDLIVSCNRNQRQYAAYADRLVGDAEADFPGPLAGIRSALAVARHPWLMILPCDAPLIDRDLLACLYQRALGQPQKPLLLRRGEQWEPLFCMIPTSLVNRVEAAWLAGERSPRRLLLALGAHSLAVAGDDPRLANFNTPERLEQDNRLGT